MKTVKANYEVSLVMYEKQNTVNTIMFAAHWMRFLVCCVPHATRSDGRTVKYHIQIFLCSF